ncbi:IQ motif and SEC7 domain-containing protein 3 [Eumeta japonica]|uniref:IQ motif and SEC7 domain-containing protein 3 n=1 Tax=Eumeta variegata TaxID=151549 RepID=A0A4C1SFU8_EUMVA|nr:IQ motif and SEC7 domain-containing protein 3 [Eumeta japonica]
MSQDLLDKQVEILERRYGGLRARRAAVTIQRAFRRRQLLKKFSDITAMAKAADSNARRLQDHAAMVNGNDIYANALLQKSPGMQDKALSLTRPMRSMSLRERHDIDMSMGNHVQCEPSSAVQSDIEAMAARVHQSAHQLQMIAADLPPHHRADIDSGGSRAPRLPSVEDK